MTKVQGSFQSLIYGPRGSIEGVLLSQDGEPAQIVFDKHDDVSPFAFADLRAGQTVTVEATPQGPSPKGEAAHAVFGYGRLIAVDGKKPGKQKTASGPAYQGTVQRLNYARHGEANGVVLDTGDFIHTKPEGMAKLKLRIGDKVQADGDAQWLATGNGWAVEATKVNGKSLHPR